MKQLFLLLGLCLLLTSCGRGKPPDKRPVWAEPAPGQVPVQTTCDSAQKSNKWHYSPPDQQPPSTDNRWVQPPPDQDRYTPPSTSQTK